MKRERVRLLQKYVLNPPVKAAFALGIVPRTYALLEKMAYSPSKPNDTANDPEVDAMIAQVMRQTDRDKINTLMRNIYTRLRSEHVGVPVVYLHSPYAASKTLGKWTPGTVMYDLFLEQLAAGK